MDYCPHTPDDIAQMQTFIGASSLDDLFADIPPQFRLKQIPDLPQALSEQETLSVMGDLAGKNKLPKS